MSERKKHLKNQSATESFPWHISCPFIFIASFLLKYVVSLPLIIKDYGANPFTFIYNLFLAPLASLEYFSYNGLSIFNIFGKNAETVNVTFPALFLPYASGF